MSRAGFVKRLASQVKPATDEEWILCELLSQDPPNTAFHISHCCDKMRAEPARGGGYNISCPVHRKTPTFKRLKCEET